MLKQRGNERFTSFHRGKIRGVFVRMDHLFSMYEKFLRTRNSG